MPWRVAPAGLPENRPRDFAAADSFFRSCSKRMAFAQKRHRRRSPRSFRTIAFYFLWRRDAGSDGLRNLFALLVIE
jgi:hypothetical protein